MIRDHGNELAVGGLALDVGDRIAEEFLQHLNVTPVPGYLYGVPNCPLHPGGRGAEFLCHRGIEHLRHRVDHFHVVDGQYDGLPQILVALDVRRYADLVDDLRDLCFQILVTTVVDRSEKRRFLSGDTADPAQKR